MVVEGLFHRFIIGQVLVYNSLNESSSFVVAFSRRSRNGRALTGFLLVFSVGILGLGLGLQPLALLAFVKLSAFLQPLLKSELIYRRMSYNAKQLFISLFSRLYTHALSLHSLRANLSPLLYLSSLQADCYLEGTAQLAVSLQLPFSFPLRLRGSDPLRSISGIGSQKLRE